MPLAFQGLLLGMLFYQQRVHTEAQDMAVHTKDVLRELAAISESILLLQNDLRGQLLALPPGIESHEPASAALPLQLARLRKLVADSPAQTQRTAAVAALVGAWGKWYGETREALAAQGPEVALTRFQSGTGAGQVREIRDVLALMRTDEERLDEERLRGLERSTHLFHRLLLIGGIANGVAAAGAMWIVARGIGRRAYRLRENVARMQTGEPLLPASRVGDELGDLDRSFHAMADALRSARARELDFQRAIERHNAALLRANHELTQKNQENEMFVYSVSHDLRSPLVNLQGFSKELGLVRDDLDALLSAPVSEAARARGKQIVERGISEPIAYIQTAVTRLSSIIDALLRLSRAGRVEYLPSRVDAGAIVRRVVDALRGSVMKKGATVTIEELPPIWGDATALEQIFANLLVNAVNYLHPQRPGNIVVGAQPREDLGLCYFVRDNGLGIAAAHQPKVFAAFQRLHEKVAPGEGIGLALVRRAVERHGGKIWVESEENVGTTFWVFMPAMESSPLQPSPKRETLHACGRRPYSPDPPPATHHSSALAS